MCKIKNISLENFRGIRNLYADDLCRINIVLGNNNCGKSSLLEAILISMGANKPSLTLEMNTNRNYSNISMDDFAMFFHNLDTSQQIRIKSDFDNSTSRDLKIAYIKKELEEIKASEIQDGQSQLFPQFEYGLQYLYNDGGEKDKHSLLLLDSLKGTIKSLSSEDTPSRRATFFMGPRYNFNDYISHFNQIVTDKEKNVVVEALHSIEPRIHDVTVVGNKVMVDVNLKKLVPINLMGDGTRKLFTVATALYNAKNGILIIDEVDNGMYYKSMKSLWKSIITMSAQLDVQVFASTHSLDSLKALNDLLSTDLSSNQKDVKIITLRKDNEDNVKCYPYAYEKFNYLLDMEEEIR